MSGIFEAIWQTLDPFKHGPNTLIEKKTSHGAHITPQLAKVAEYHPEDHTASVVALGAGGNTPVRMKVATHYQGSQPGTGEAIALFPGQLVRAVLGPEGIWSAGTIVQALFTHGDRYSPDHPIWKQQKNNGVKICMNEGKDGEGNVSIVDKQSNNYVVTVGEEHKEALGSVSNVQAGPHMTYTEKKTKELSSKIATISDNQKT